jgi:hypothetical protein
MNPTQIYSKKNKIIKQPTMKTIISESKKECMKMIWAKFTS